MTAMTTAAIVEQFRSAWGYRAAAFIRPMDLSRFIRSSSEGASLLWEHCTKSCGWVTYRPRHRTLQ